jgi:hypothetical protein
MNKERLILDSAKLVYSLETMGFNLSIYNAHSLFSLE